MRNESHNGHTDLTMAFSNPQNAQVVGFLRIVRFQRVPSSLSGAFSRAENSWPIVCVVSPIDHSIDPIVEVRIGLVCAAAFVEQLDTIDEQVVKVIGTRWIQHDDMTNRRRLIDVMFDPTITAAAKPTSTDRVEVGR